MVASFDPYNTASKDGETDTQSTLSLLDMTYVKPAHEKLDQLFAEEKRAIEESSDNYANISIAASGAYTFMGRTQIDLISLANDVERLVENIPLEIKVADLWINRLVGDNQPDAPEPGLGQALAAIHRPTHSWTRWDLRPREPCATTISALWPASRPKP